METVIFVLCCVGFFVEHVTSETAEGQKAHFQVHDKKPGMLSIHATKTQAKITATADSIQMVVDPGTEEIPKGYVSSSKRDEVNMDMAIGKRNKLLTKKHSIYKKHLNHKNKLRKAHDVNGAKKSVVDKEMRVHGQSGALHIHTDHNFTTLNSESGKLEVYIKNPEHYKDQAEHHDNIRVNVHTEAYKKSDASNLPNVFHIAEDVTGLKKSIVNPSKLVLNPKKSIVNRKKKDEKHSKMTMCVIPPCSTVH